MRIALLAPLVAALAITAGAEPRLAVLFAERARVTVAGGGLARLELPPAILARVRPDLGDLRLVGEDEDEIPFLLLPGFARSDRLEASVRTALAILEAEREILGSSENSRRAHERYVIELPRSILPDGAFLTVVTSRIDFTRQIRVFSPAAGLRLESSIFRLPDGSEKLAVQLPGGFAGRLTIELEGQDDRPLSPAFALERSTELGLARPPRIALSAIESWTEPDRQVLIVDRPGGLVVDRLRFGTDSTFFDRLVVVEDLIGDAGLEIGRGRLTRVGAPSDSSFGRAGDLERIEIALAEARGRRLRISLLGGDGAPLEDLTIEAEIRQPAMIFAVPGGGGSAWLLFGGGRAGRPDYDVEHLSPGLPAEGEPARLGRILLDRHEIAAAEIGPTEPNPAFNSDPALAFTHRPGSLLDTGGFAWQRTVGVPDSPDGLARIGLDPEIVGRARPDLADLRIVDREGRQWSYLLESGRRATCKLGLGSPRSQNGTTSFLFVLPAEAIQLESLSLRIDAPYFDRPFGIFDGNDRRLASGRLVREPGHGHPLEISMPGQRVSSLRLEVIDGDDPPLQLSAVSARTLLADVYLPAPRGDYRLLYGNVAAAAPQYEVQALRPLVLAVRSAPAELGPAEKNPGADRLPRLFTGPAVWVWAALGMSVAVLLAMTFRLLRQDG